MAGIILDNVWKYYNDIPAIKGIYLEIHDREFFVLLGPSGAGKTTTLKLIAGIEEPSKGNIYIDGNLMNGISPDKRDVAMTFESYALYPHLTVYENIASPLLAPGRKMTKLQVDSVVKKVSQMLSIDNLLHRMPSELSGGQRQRVSLARCIVRTPKVFLLDEPLSHLDAKIRNQMRVELPSIISTCNATIVYVTHDYVEALSLADRIAIINHGEIIQIGTPNDVYNEPCTEFVARMIGQPEINLIEAIPAIEREEVFLDLANGFRLSISRALFAKVSKVTKQKLRVGIRPHDIGVMTYSTQRTSYELPAEVFAFTPLAHQGILYVKIPGGQIIRVLCDAECKFDVDQRVFLTFQCDKFLLFDASTGKRL